MDQISKARFALSKWNKGLKFVFGLLILFGTPLIIGTLFAPANSDNWIGFFGSYFGCVIGSLAACWMAYHVAQKQIRQSDKQFKFQSQQAKLELLVLIRHELNFMFKELKRAKKYADGIKWKAEADLDQTQLIPMDFEDNDPYAPDHYQKTNGEHWKKIGVLQDYRLIDNLLDLKDTYDEFTEIVGQDVSDLLEIIIPKLERRQSQAFNNTKDKFVSIKTDHADQWTYAFSDYKIIKENKKRVWKRIQSNDKNVVSMASGLLVQVKDRINQLSSEG